MIASTGLGILASYNSQFQTLLVNGYLKSFAKKLGTRISVSKIEASIFEDLTLSNLYVEDLFQDTLLYAEKVELDIDVFSLKQKRIILEGAEITNGFFNLKKDANNKGTNLDFIVKQFSSKDTTPSEWIFGLNSLELRKMRFDYNAIDSPEKKAGVDYNHISVSYLDLLLDDINLIEKGVDCKIRELKFFEKSGFQVDQFSANANVSPSGIITEHLNIHTPYSAIDGNVTFLTSSYKDLKSFIDKVTIKSFFDNTNLDFKDICFFAPKLDCLNKSLNLSGEIKGKVSNIKGRKLSIVTNDGSKFKGEVDMSGLPVPEDIFLHINVEELITTKSKVESVPMYPFVEETFIKLPSNFRHLGTVRFRGKFTGFYHDFVTYGKLKTSLGNLKTDLAVKIKQGEPQYEGSLVSDNFNLGRLFEMEDDVGDITMNVKINGKGFSKEDIDANLSGNIEKVNLKGYEYNEVEVQGNFKNQIFEGFLAVKDENISFDFNGGIDLSKKIPELNFTSNIKNAKLAKLNLIKSKEKLKTRFSTRLDVNLAGNGVDDMTGEIRFVDSRYTDLLDTILVEEVLITSTQDTVSKKIKIVSDLLDAEVSGYFHFKEIKKFVQNFFNRYIPSQIDEDHLITNLSDDLKFNIEFHNSELVSKVLLDGIKMSDHTTIVGDYNSVNHKLKIIGSSPYIDAHGIKVNNFSLNTNAVEDVLSLTLNADKIYATDSLFIENFGLTSVAQADSFITDIGWENTSDTIGNKGDVNILTRFEGFTSVTSKFINSSAIISGVNWDIRSNNTINLDTSSFFVRGLNLVSKDQSILIDGRLSNDANDQLDMLLKNFDLQTLKQIIPKEVINVDGTVNGLASITKQKGELIFTSDLKLSRFRLNENLIGEGIVQSAWNSSNRFVKLDGKFHRDHIPAILFGGYYYPTRKENKLDLFLSLYQMELSIFDIYTNKFISDIRGNANAKIKLSGTFKQPSLNGHITLNNTEFTVNYLKTRYSTNLCKINVSPDMISFDNIEFQDKYKNKALANGAIFHEWFSDWNIGIGIDVNNFLSLNTAEKDNGLYFGRAFGTGLVDIGFYDNQVNIDVDVKTEKNTVLNIPLSDSKDLVENDFIEFISHDTLEVKGEESHVDLSNISMNFNLDITPEAQVRLIFDDQIGDVMRSSGKGNLNLRINNDGELNIYGNYNVTDGDYLFTLQNVINKRFDLEEGGTISWNGDPYEADINLTAVYRLRARLYDLLLNVDTSDIYKKRIPVNLKLNMTKSMLNPDINFDIDLPTADEDTKSKVRSILYVSDKQENIQELNKQVFSLLVLNRFLSPAGSKSAYSSANVGSTTSSELLSNQLSNWLSKISNDFDIGVNYRPGDELSNQELELALSTQFFNDRLILDGNLGLSDRNNLSSQTENTNNLIGDVSLEYKITQDGKLRVKAFNNSNEFSLEDINSPYTQGVGISYKEEYDTNKEFWQKLFSRFKSKSRRTSSK